MAASLRELFCCAAMGCALLGTAPVVLAEQLDDPTRPAIQLVPGLPGAGDGYATPPPVARGLQSVIISHKREAAIINGVEVEQGQQYGDAVLSEVNESCVVLIGPKGRQVMHMFPTVSLTKNEMDCVRKPDMQSLQKVDAAAAGANPAAIEQTKAVSKRKARVGSHKVTGVAVEDKDGSGK